MAKTPTRRSAKQVLTRINQDMFKLFLLQEGATLGEDKKNACSIQGNTNMNLLVGWYCPEQVCRTIQPILKEYIVVRNEEG